MKSQCHNEGELRELKVKIEKDVVDSFEKMSQETNMDMNELVVIAMKRFRASHSDYERTSPKFD